MASVAWTCLGATALSLLDELDRLAAGRASFAPKDARVLVLGESSIQEARLTASRLATKLGFGPTRRTKLATAASELARNIQMYAGTGALEWTVLLEPERALVMRAWDRGPGIRDLEAVLGGTYRSTSGMGLGLRGVREIADAFEVESRLGVGTSVTSLFRAPSLPSVRPLS